MCVGHHLYTQKYARCLAHKKQKHRINSGLAEESTFHSETGRNSETRVYVKDAP
jgi:hypothetical protein